MLSGQLFAQCTPVDCLSGLPAWGGLCAQSLLDGRVGEPYTDVLSFHITNACTPATVFDPTLTGVSVRITQVSSIGFSQLPAGISGATNQPSYTPPANGCGSLSGTPSQAGVFDASVDLVVNVNAWPFSVTCGGFGPVPQNNNPVSFALSLTILPDPSFDAPAAPLCVTDAPVQLVPTGTLGGSFAGPGVVGDAFDPALAGVGVHEVWYIVSAQEGAAVAPATDSLSVLIVVNADCLGDCDAFAGTLGGVDFIPCLAPGGSVELIGIPGGDAVVPEGFEVVYGLTQGPGLVIVDAGPEPVFSVTSAGLFTIHTLVYDPATLDLGAVQFGITTGFDVNALLIQGGGGICGSLDVAGVSYTVVECTGACDADAGTLSGGGPVCLENGEASLIAAPNGDAVVPEGFMLAYGLTQGPGLVVVGAALQPEFVVTEPDLYTIHALVFDPATLDLGAIEFGVTTGFDIAGLLVQGGGSICGSLDLQGTAFLVEVCSGAPQAGAPGFTMHPNPTDGLLFLRPAQAVPGDLEVLDMSGRVVRAMRIGAGERTVAIELGGALSPGSYVVRLMQAGARWEKPLIVRP